MFRGGPSVTWGRDFLTSWIFLAPPQDLDSFTAFNQIAAECAVAVWLAIANEYKSRLVHFPHGSGL